MCGCGMRPLTPPSVRARLPRAQPSKPMNKFYAPWCAMNVFGCAESEIKAPNVFFQAHLARPQAHWSIRSGCLPESTAAVCGFSWLLESSSLSLAITVNRSFLGLIALQMPTFGGLIDTLQLWTFGVG
jgi:hypothetical protein